MLLTDTPESQAVRARPPAVILAAACMASAGVVHAAAAGAHNDHALMATMFAVTSVAQLGWAAMVMIKPSRGLYALGALLAFGAIGVWSISKIWGIGFVDGLVGPQSVGFQDAIATLLQLVAGISVLGALWRPARGGSGSIVVRRLAVVLGALALVTAVPASAAPHSGDHDDHDVAGGHVHDADQEADHDDGEVWVIDGYPFQADITEEQAQAAQQLVDDTRDALAETDYWDYDAAREAGYVSIGDQATGFEHLIHLEYMQEETTLNPERIESLVYRVAPNGTRSLVSAMYLMGTGNTMDDIPDIAGEVTEWHDHQDLCWNPDNPTQVVGTTNDDGECERGVFRPTAPMLHVWLVDHRCGPFAGIEGGGHGEECDHEH